jgi:hypothetical protein
LFKLTAKIVVVKTQHKNTCSVCAPPQVQTQNSSGDGTAQELRNLALEIKLCFSFDHGCRLQRVKSLHAACGYNMGGSLILPSKKNDIPWLSL